MKQPRAAAPPLRGDAMNRILIMTGDARAANALKQVLKHANGPPFHIEWVRLLSRGLKRLRSSRVDAIIVDVSLADGSGIATLDQLISAAPHTPILTLGGVEDSALTRDAVRHGAQGCLLKGHFDFAPVPEVVLNIIERKAAEEAFYRETVRAEIVLNSISDAVISTDMAGMVDYLNAAAEGLTGWSRDEARGRPISDVFHIVSALTREADLNPVALVLESDEVMGLKAETILIRRDGSESMIEDSASPIHDWAGKSAGAVVVFHDVSAARAMTAKMTHMAQHDFLTDLPNRSLLNDRIALAIELAGRTNTQLAVLFIDLDNFKHINDSLGHRTGDALLLSVTERLRTCVRGSDTVSRQGGDEFVILLAGLRREEVATSIALKIIAAMQLPHRIGERQLHVGASVGVSLYPTDGKDAETLIKNADIAMYHAKSTGRNNHKFFSSDMNARAVDRQRIEASLRLGLERHEFELHYQPIVNLTTGTINGAEALLRWRHPECGVLLPERFIAIAEDCGLIVPIGRWVLREACAQAQRWREDNLAPVLMAVNVSTCEFRQMSFLMDLSAILIETGMDPEWLQLELTEGVLMRDSGPGAAMLRELKQLGVQLALDDFGTGYSSLSYLKRFPIDTLKIDQSFMHDIASVGDEGIIVSAVIAMGNSLKKRVIAEGVEHPSQLTFLNDRHCEEGQGYLFSHPVTASAFASLLATAALPPAASLGDRPELPRKRH